CAHMVERNPGVVRSAAWDRRKRRDRTPLDLIDVSALCDENVARSEPGIRGLSWSDSHVFFQTSCRWRWIRNRSQHRDIPHAVDRIDVLGAVFGHDQISLGSGHAYGAVLSWAKDNGDINK